ncbi:mucin-2-like [Haliotis asinina]|uniref:mucin-2-like n=1 Tax=Haliotis asinina TaxID=109174 RepID=UPI0035319D75
MPSYALNTRYLSTPLLHLQRPPTYTADTRYLSTSLLHLQHPPTTLPTQDTCLLHFYTYNALLLHSRHKIPVYSTSTPTTPSYYTPDTRYLSNPLLHLQRPLTTLPTQDTCLLHFYTYGALLLLSRHKIPVYSTSTPTTPSYYTPDTRYLSTPRLHLQRPLTTLPTQDTCLLHFYTYKALLLHSRHKIPVYSTSTPTTPSYYTPDTRYLSTPRLHLRHPLTTLPTQDTCLLHFYTYNALLLHSRHKIPVYSTSTPTTPSYSHSRHKTPVYFTSTPTTPSYYTPDTRYLSTPLLHLQRPLTTLPTHDTCLLHVYTYDILLLHSRHKIPVYSTSTPTTPSYYTPDTRYLSTPLLHLQHPPTHTPDTRHLSTSLLHLQRPPTTLPRQDTYLLHFYTYNALLLHSRHKIPVYSTSTPTTPSYYTPDTRYLSTPLLHLQRPLTTLPTQDACLLHVYTYNTLLLTLPKQDTCLLHFYTYNALLLHSRHTIPVYSTSTPTTPSYYTPDTRYLSTPLLHLQRPPTTLPTQDTCLLHFYTYNTLLLHSRHKTPVYFTSTPTTPSYYTPETRYLSTPLLHLQRPPTTLPTQDTCLLHVYTYNSLLLTLP